MSDKTRNGLTILLLIVLVISAFAAGYFIREIIAVRNGSVLAQEEFDVFWEAWGRIEVDLHTGPPPPPTPSPSPTPGPTPDTLHIDSHQAFLFVYPGPDCDLPDALTNIGPSGIDCVIQIWGQEDIGGDPGKEWPGSHLFLNSSF